MEFFGSNIFPLEHSALIDADGTDRGPIGARGSSIHVCIHIQ